MNETYMIGAVVLGISTLLNMGSAIASIRASTRTPDRQPPVPEEMAKVYATKAELINFRCEWQRTCAALHTKTDETMGKLFDLDRESEYRLAEWQRGISLQLGRIENAISKDNT